MGRRDRRGLRLERPNGMARKWYDSQEYFKANWKNIKHKLEKQFAKPLPFAKLLKEAALYETHEG
jgi:1-aminocyclopropane-1-carboxylate deaminase/D-cysteine desulfhydrase-like pyridoxal-dependent ACC family enzyme